jgi:hypothetical protein
VSHPLRRSKSATVRSVRKASPSTQRKLRGLSPDALTKRSNSTAFKPPRKPASTAVHESDILNGFLHIRPDLDPRARPHVQARQPGFFRFVDTRLQRLRADADDAEPEQWAKLRRMIALCASDDSLFPNVSDDGDGGVFSEWRAAGWHLEMGLEADSEPYAHATDDQGQTIFSYDIELADAVDPRAIRKIRNLLRHLTRLANSQNPDWKSLYTHQ